jgi:DNA-binding NarL/FixJ family response regulator
MGTGAGVRQNQPVSRRILIVDDHPEFRATARRMLESEGFDVVGEAADAAAAIEAVARLRPEMVLLDVQLPDVDGVRVSETIAAGDEHPDVVLTSSRPRDDLGSLEGSGALGFVPKDELSGDAIEALLP